MLICIAFLHRCDIAALGFSPLSNNLTSQQFYNYQITQELENHIFQKPNDSHEDIYESANLPSCENIH